MQIPSEKMLRLRLVLADLGSEKLRQEPEVRLRILSVRSSIKRGRGESEVMPFERCYCRNRRGI